MDLRIPCRPSQWKSSKTATDQAEATMPVPAGGPVGLEGDRGQMEYRRIRIRQGAVD
jgi:hypothetical protein